MVLPDYAVADQHVLARNDMQPVNSSIFASPDSTLLSGTSSLALSPNRNKCADHSPEGSFFCWCRLCSAWWLERGVLRLLQDPPTVIIC